jgi:hypothetical protein
MYDVFKLRSLLSRFLKNKNKIKNTTTAFTAVGSRYLGGINMFSRNPKKFINPLNEVTSGKLPFNKSEFGKKDHPLLIEIIPKI